MINTCVDVKDKKDNRLVSERRARPRRRASFVPLVMGSSRSGDNAAPRWERETPGTRAAVRDLIDHRYQGVAVGRLPPSRGQRPGMSADRLRPGLGCAHSPTV